METKNAETSSEDLFEHYKFVVDPKQELLRIDKYLMNFILNATRSKIQQAAKDEQIIVNDKPVKANYKVKPNDVIRVMLTYPPAENTILPEDIPLNIVYEDDDVLVINKPAGMVVHPGHGNTSGTLVNALAYHFDNLPTNDRNRPGLVHRIDKDTTGLLVIAKNEEALAHLNEQFFNKTTERIYYALVWGDVVDDSGTITGNIARHPKNRLIMTVFDEDANEYAKPAVTHYKVLERFGYVTLISCQLETGRTHQIRVHLKHIGHTLFNDERYGGDAILKGTTFTKYKQFVENCFRLIPRQALHAKTLGFTHPKTGKMMRFESETPNDLVQVLEKWRNYSTHKAQEEM
jgi:23S rRNA pseudouridine1911/1915/1917 synthase